MSRELEVGSHVLAAGEPDGLHVTLVHGLEDTWSTWRPLADRLDPTWRVHALDLPWRAGTDYTWRRGKQPADWLADALDPGTDLVVAHSYGATTLLELLGQQAVPHADVVLVCPLYLPAGASVTWTMLDRARESFVQNIREGVAARLGSRATVVDPEVLEGMMERTLERVGPTGLLTVFDRFVTSSHIPLDDVAHRVLVVAGGNDPTLSPTAAQHLAWYLRRGTARVHESFDHFCYVRRVDEVAGDVLDFAAPTGSAADRYAERETA